MRKVVFTLSLMVLSFSMINAQEVSKKEKETLGIKFKEDAKPLIFVDGKKFDFPIYLIDESKIKSMTVIKGEEAKKRYNAPNGAVLIITRYSSEENETLVKIREKHLDKNLKPLIIIDGKVADEKSLKSINKDKVKTVDIVKGKKAKEKYNAENGVIVITTKKGN